MKYLWVYTCMFQLRYRDLRTVWQMDALCCPVKSQSQVKSISFMSSVSLQQPEEKGIAFSPVKEIEVLQNTVCPCNFLRRLYHLRNAFFCYLNLVSCHHCLAIHRVRLGIKKANNHLLLSVLMQRHLDFKNLPKT